MRTLMKVTIPVNAGNRGVADGSLPRTIEAFVTRVKPEAAYFLPEAGKRCAIFVFDLEDTSMIPALAETFFQKLDASVELHPVMNLEDFRRGIPRAAKANGRKTVRSGRKPEARAR